MPRRTSVDKQIRAQQNSVDPIVPWTAFCRLANEVLEDVTDKAGFNIRSEAVRALQCSTEDMLVNMFREADRLATYTGRETVSEADILFMRNGVSSVRSADTAPAPPDEAQDPAYSLGC